MRKLLEHVCLRIGREKAERTMAKKEVKLQESRNFMKLRKLNPASQSSEMKGGLFLEFQTTPVSFKKLRRLSWFHVS